MLLIVALLLTAVTSDVLHVPAPKLPGRARLGADKDGGPTGTIGGGRDKRELRDRRAANEGKVAFSRKPGSAASITPRAA